MLNFCGIVWRWNAYDPMLRQSSVFGIELFWRSYQPRLWWKFSWNDWEESASLQYSHGRKGKQASGWTLRGPLVKFTAEHL